MNLVFLAAAFLHFVLAVNAGELADRSVLRIALKEYTRPTAAAGLEFAADGRSMVVWWWPHPAIGDQRRLPLEFVIFDTLGNVLSVSRSSTNRAMSLKDFPSISWRETQQVFLKDAKTLAFSRDFSKGLRFTKINYNEYFAEMWALPAKGKPLWPTTLPYVEPRPVSLFFDTTDRTILLEGPMQKVAVLQLETGEIADEFSLGPIESDMEILKRKRKFGIHLDIDDPGLRFIAHTLSLDPKKQETSTTREPTEIFETSTWKVVWKENDPEINAVTMSSDGTKIAFLRGNTLEVHPFEKEQLRHTR